MNSYIWRGQRTKPKASGVHNVEAIFAMKSRLTAMMEEKIGNMTTGTSSKNNQIVIVYACARKGKERPKKDEKERPSPSKVKGKFHEVGTDLASILEPRLPVGNISKWSLNDED
ncbi:hypothetical protein M9H77_02402 [Catharanthus roseus]|uniref:Uncharacterized protein n=1 Tax=Catharanthus roseus TaxID=4058 RepID=A0ACC0C8G1_CATRO|nr:hypothetical protein M9H77_02402 [Catharanthus roseus]